MSEGRGRRNSPEANAPAASILVIDDEELIRDTLAEYLSANGFSVVACASGEEGLARVQQLRFDVVLCDLQLPGIDGLQVLEKVQRLSPETAVVLVTAYASVDTAIAAFQRGASDYLMKPVLLDEVRAKVSRLLAYRELAQENRALRRELNRADAVDWVIGSSPAMARVVETIRKVAPTRSTVLILGESGSGKELVARAIHAGGLTADADAREYRFLPVNCAAIPNELLESQLFGHRRGAFTGAERDRDGVFLHAGRGTVFLDEIGEMPLATQSKLLRVIEQKEVLPVGANEPSRVEARVLAASNKDLWKEVEAGQFREDLFYRLNVVTIQVPPLRDRREDIPELVEFLLARHARTVGKRVTGVTHEAMQLLMAGRWRGNIRELDNALQRAVILGDGPLLGPADLPPDLAPPVVDPGLVEDLNEAVRRFEKQHVERILRRCPDKREAARRLGIGLSSLYRRIAELGIGGVEREG